MGSTRHDLAPANSQFSIGGIEAKTLANAYGTPLYVTDLDRVEQRYDSAMGSLLSKYDNCLLAFAFKSNPTRAVVEALSKRGAGATIVSQAGLALANTCGVEPSKVVFDGPSKSRDELAAAIRAKIGMINAESTEEVLDIDSLCSRLETRKIRVGFRVNLGIEAETHAGLATGSRQHKFGVSRKEVVRFCKQEASKLRHVRLVGLHSHIGSQITDVRVFKRQTEDMVRLAEEIRRESGYEIDEINLGGGLGMNYERGGEDTDFDDYAEATAGTFAKSRKNKKTHGVRLVFELGRSIVADSTVLLTRVNYVKKVGETNWALVDAGMNDFLRPALYGAYHEIVPAHVSHKGRASVAYSIGGPVCESTDVFGTNRKLGVKLTRGDLLAILDTGAYGISMASRYNMRDLPAVAVITKGMHRLAQPRG